MESESAPTSFFVVSSINVGLTSAVYSRLRSLLPGRFPEHRFAFPENIFRDKPHPLMWQPHERDATSSGRLMECWGRLASHLHNVIRPEIEDGKIVVQQRLGIDVLNFANARMPSLEPTAEGRREIEWQNNEAEALHHDIVKHIVKAGGKPLPQYLIPLCGDPETITEDWVAQWPALREVNIATLRAFIQHEKEAMQRYFTGHGQRNPIYLRSFHSVELMVEEALRAMAEMLPPPTRSAIAAA
jgi:hypothetical protein